MFRSIPPLPTIDQIARAIDPDPWDGVICTRNGEDVTGALQSAARSAARRVFALLSTSSS